MKQVYHHYREWEDWQNGMWRKEAPDKEKEFLAMAIEFTGNYKLYGKWMLEVTEKWPVCCEHNLTNPSINQRAWIGHAAACLAINCPEYITRMAWGHLTEKQRIDANSMADYAIMMWKERYMGTKNDCLVF